MSVAPHDAIRISSADLRTLAELLTMRFPLRGPEATRAARVRRLLSAAAELSRTVGLYAQHAQAQSHRQAGASDLVADTQALDDALRAFSTEVDQVARDYHDAVNHPRARMEDSAEFVAPLGGDFMPWHPPADGMASV